MTETIREKLMRELEENEVRLNSSLSNYILLKVSQKPRSLKDLMEGCGCSRAIVQQNLKTLREKGFLEMVKIDRKYPYCLTEKGKQYMEKMK